MQGNKTIRKCHGVCESGKKKCGYAQSTLCCFFQVQLEEAGKALHICNQIYSPSYVGKP